MKGEYNSVDRLYIQWVVGLLGLWYGCNLKCLGSIQFKMHLDASETT